MTGRHGASLAAYPVSMRVTTVDPCSSITAGSTSSRSSRVGSSARSPSASIVWSFAPAASANSTCSWWSGAARCSLRRTSGTRASPRYIVARGICRWFATSWRDFSLMCNSASRNVSSSSDASAAPMRATSASACASSTSSCSWSWSWTSSTTGAAVAAGFSAGAFFGAAFVAGAFLAGASSAVALAAGSFLAVAFLAVAFCAAAFLAGAFSAAVFPAGAFLVGAIVLSFAHLGRMRCEQVSSIAT